MSQAGTITELPLAPESKIALTNSEVKFLDWFYLEAITSQRHRNFRLLELAVIYQLYVRCGTKIAAGEAAKLKLYLGELIALKRILLSTTYFGAWTAEAYSVLGKLDQLTVGIQ